MALTVPNGGTEYDEDDDVFLPTEQTKTQRNGLARSTSSVKTHDRRGFTLGSFPSKSAL